MPTVFEVAPGVLQPNHGIGWPVGVEVGPHLAAPRRLEHAEHDAAVVAENRQENKRVANQYGYDELAAAAKAAAVARDALRATPNAVNLASAQQALASVHQRMVVVEAYYVAYRAIPYEADAHDVGEEAALAFELSR